MSTAFTVLTVIGAWVLGFLIGFIEGYNAKEREIYEEELEDEFFADFEDEDIFADR